MVHMNEYEVELAIYKKAKFLPWPILFLASDQKELCFTKCIQTVDLRICETFSFNWVLKMQKT